MEQEHSLFDISNVRDILTILFKHKFKIIITFLLISVGATIIAFQINESKSYESKSVLLVKFGREFMARPEEGRPGPVIPQQAIISGEISILTSRDLLVRVVKELGAETIYPGLGRGGNVGPTETAVQRLKESIAVENIRGSNLIEINFAHSDPIMAATVVNMLVDRFKEKHLEVFSGEGPEFLESQLSTSQTKLREAESNLSSFRQRNRIFSFEEQRTNLIGQKGTLDTNLKAALTQISELEQRIAFIKSPRWPLDSPPELRAQLLTLQQRERELSERYVEGSRAVQNVRQEIQAAKETIKRSSEETRQVELARAEGELGIVKARADTLRRQLGQVEGEIGTLDARSRELLELRRAATSHEQNYQTYSRRLDESQIVEEMDRRKMVAISIVEKATPNSVAKKSRFGKSLLIPMGFFGGIAAGIALAFLLELLSPGMTTPMSAERRLGIPVMVAITKKG
jgi:uncharacterized protein involved in exopolysaccharide biosynthesis